MPLPFLNQTTLTSFIPQMDPPPPPQELSLSFGLEWGELVIMLIIFEGSINV